MSPCFDYRIPFVILIQTPTYIHIHTCTNTLAQILLAPERYVNQPAYCRSLCSPLPKKLKIKDSQNPLLLEYVARKKQMIAKQGINNCTKLNEMDRKQKKTKNANICFSKHSLSLSLCLSLTLSVCPSFKQLSLITDFALNASV